LRGTGGVRSRFFSAQFFASQIDKTAFFQQLPQSLELSTKFIDS
jgi:hypothetical protein